MLGGAQPAVSTSRATAATRRRLSDCRAREVNDAVVRSSAKCMAAELSAAYNRRTFLAAVAEALDRIPALG